MGVGGVSCWGQWGQGEGGGEEGEEAGPFGFLDGCLDLDCSGWMESCCLGLAF